MAARTLIALSICLGALFASRPAAAESTVAFSCRCNADCSGAGSVCVEMSPGFGACCPDFGPDCPADAGEGIVACPDGGPTPPPPPRMDAGGGMVDAGTGETASGGCAAAPGGRGGFGIGAAVAALALVIRRRPTG